MFTRQFSCCGFCQVKRKERDVCRLHQCGVQTDSYVCPLILQYNLSHSNPQIYAIFLTTFPSSPPSLPSQFPSAFSKLDLQNFNSMALNSTPEGCDAYSVIVLSDECDNGLQCELPIDFSSPAATEVVIPLKSQLSLDGRLSNQSYINMVVENAVAYSVDVDDIEKGKLDARSNNEETVGNLKNDQVLTKSLQKQISFDMGGKYMQLLMNHSLMLTKFSSRDKIAGEKVVDAPRSRKYKRAASFNSRKVVLLFSVLSSLGTIILIYLTLRVRHMGDASIRSE